MKPISPNDEKLEINNLPDSVIESFNDLIIEKWNGTYAIITQNEAVTKIYEAETINGNIHFTRDMVFDKGFLNIEQTFRKVGWNVVYNKQSIDDTFEPHWKFRKD